MRKKNFLFCFIKLIIPGFILLFCSKINAQQNYPTNYFSNPLGIPIQLAANFGEIRSNHFHMGLDIRTQGKENLPVFAAADGYVSRIKIEKYGYGRAIYITHPNGYITLYAHLNNFYPLLDDYVKNKQYADKSWEQDFILPTNQFTVNKGQFIAYSGNTGGSQGPHLHFEIMDAKTGNNLNPELFGLVSDNVAPAISGLYFYDRRYSTYLAPANNIALKKIGANNFTSIADTFKTGTPVMSLGIKAQDKNSSTSFYFGIYSASLWIDDSLLSSFTLNNFSNDDSRYINACIDYTKYKNSKTEIQHLSILPGNKLNIFSSTPSNGLIILTDTIAHKITIEVADRTGNSSIINFILRYDKSKEKNFDFLRYAKPGMPGIESTMQSANAKAIFSKNAFYDEVAFAMSEMPPTSPMQVSNNILLYNYFVPVHDYYTVMIKTSLAADSPLRGKAVMQLKYGEDSDLVAATWQNDFCAAKFKTLGTARVMIDTTAPVISIIGLKDSAIIKTQKSILVKCTDNLGETKNFAGRLDGNWILFSKKGNTCTYIFDEHCAPGAHSLQLSVSDVAGNIAEKNFNFTKQ